MAISLDTPLYIDGEKVECAFPECDEDAVVRTTDIAWPWLCHDCLIRVRDKCADKPSPGGADDD